MRNHPATKARAARAALEGAELALLEECESAPRETGAGAAILDALEGGDVLERPDVYALGARQKVTPATARARRSVSTRYRVTRCARRAGRTPGARRAPVSTY